eukprot:TRINITY_DN822_c0_g2_i1.p1 TRINITY_DN822_c0_g2~~TRINITY_DN822_c0_g2_i1.p1  ORF type:complete len:398 (-),score=85.17 TRINITY_DN822_c0_g2_i1:78-1271(-)
MNKQQLSSSTAKLLSITLENLTTKARIPLQLLENTPQTLGRGSLLDIPSKKVSKDQITIFHTTTKKEENPKHKDSSVSIKCIGTNPTFVKKSLTGEVKVLNSGKEDEDHCEIQQGDIIIFVLPEYSFTVHMHNSADIQTKEDSEKSPSSGEKRKVDQIEGGVAREDKGKAAVVVKEKEPSRDAFSVLMSKKPTPKEAQTKGESSSKRVPGASSGWSDVLSIYCVNPERYSEEVFYFDDQIVVIYDKFPKARFHYLVMPRKLVDGFKNLTRVDVPLIESLWERGKLIANEVKEKVSPTIEFQLGFHAVPSMRQLHMHVISRDFNSSSLKNKKHWNSFTTKFFVDVGIFIQQLRDSNRVHFDKEEYEGLLKRDLQCHICRCSISTIPALKDHIKLCKKR